MTWRRNPRTVTHVLVALARALRFTLAGVLGTALLAACASTGQRVLVPWRAGNAMRFQTGTLEERRAQAAPGWLPITLSRPTGGWPLSLRRVAARVWEAHARCHLDAVGPALGHALPGPWDRHGCRR
jgi:hypothetical protein